MQLVFTKVQVSFVNNFVTERTDLAVLPVANGRANGCNVSMAAGQLPELVGQALAGDQARACIRLKRRRWYASNRVSETKDMGRLNFN